MGTSELGAVLGAEAHEQTDSFRVLLYLGSLVGFWPLSSLVIFSFVQC